MKAPPIDNEIPHMTAWETRRLKEQHLGLLLQQRKEEIKNETQLFRMEKQDLLDLA